jgi:NAD(P)-dependent dehydrogenase (short-subunit alcohol dehydrogenase family)
MAALEGAARRVRYHAVDVRDPDAVDALLADVRADHGRIDGLVHAAGIREDKLIRDKEPASFQRVLDTKAATVEALIDGLDDDGWAILFGSVAGVFGNPGQVDYAAANGALDGTARAMAGTRRRVCSLDWGPWGGTGMVTPELARTYAARGVGLIDLDDGVARVLDELAHGLPDSTVVLMRATPDALTAHAAADHHVSTAP